MSISLCEAIEQAQTAFDSGDYRSVVESCSRIIDQYSSYTAAQRLLGQAYLEQGQPGEAEPWFAKLLAHDPREASAYLGLGLIAEDRGILDHALAYCQVAWELAPEQARYRETITRVAEKRYGADGRLRLTHAALAQIHAGAWRLRRAIKEYQSALIALPDRIDLWMGLAETLWILGEDTDAAEIAREFLKENDGLVPALVILTDIEHRSGNQAEAEMLRERLHRFDPDSALATAMVSRNSLADADFLLVNPEGQPIVTERVDAVVNERPQFVPVPAPDFSFQPDEGTQAHRIADLDDLQPISPEEFADDPDPATAGFSTSSFVPEDLTEEEPDTVEVEALDPDQPSVELIEHVLDEEVLQTEDAVINESTSSPGSVPGGSVLGGALIGAAAGLAAAAASGDQSDPPDEEVLGDYLEDLDGIEPMSLDEFGAEDNSVPAGERGFFEDADIDFDIRIEDPDAVQIGGSPPKQAPGVFAAGGSLNVASGLASDEFPELPEVDDEIDIADIDAEDKQTVLLGPHDVEELEADPTNPPESDAIIEPVTETTQEPGAAGAPAGTGFTRLLGELGNEGLAPFDPSRTAVDGAPIVSSEGPGGENAPTIPSLADGWDDIDAELASATPGATESMDELLDIDQLGIEPFALDDEDMDYVTAVRPASPPIRPGPIDELDNLASEEVHDPPAIDEQAGHVVDISEVPGVEPFAIEEFDDIANDEPFEFGVLPWERQEGGAEGEMDIDIDGLIEGVGSNGAIGASQEPQSDHFADDPFTDDPSMEITRELGSGAVDPNFALRMAEVEEAARQNLDRMHQDHGDEPFEPVPGPEISAPPQEPPPGSDFLSNPTAERLVSDEKIFSRTRTAKDRLVSQGVIRGDREIGVDMPETAAGYAEPSRGATAVSLSSQSGDDLAALRAAVEQNPQDDSLRWELAEALRDREKIHEAFTEYRWLIRHSPDRHDAVIASLEDCANHDLEADLAHRLLADIYRRRGDNAQARNHASMAMATRRLMREIRM